MPIAYRIRKHYYYIFFQFIIALESHFRIRISYRIFCLEDFFSGLSLSFYFSSPWFWFCTLSLSKFSFNDGHSVILSVARCAITRVKICFQSDAKGCFDHFSQSYYSVKCSILNISFSMCAIYFRLMFSQWFNQIEVYALNGFHIGKNGLKIKCKTKERGERISRAYVLHMLHITYSQC